MSNKKDERMLTGLRKRLGTPPYYGMYGRRFSRPPGVVEPAWGPERNRLGTGMDRKEAWALPPSLDTARKGEKQAKDWTCKNNIIEYTKNSSMHGLKYIGLEELHSCERCFWGMSFLMAVVAASYFIWNLFSRFNHAPVIMSLSPTDVDLATIPFPAITICNMNNFRKRNAESILSQSTNGVPNRDRKLMADMCGSDTDTADKMFNNTPWDYMRSFMISNTQPCHELFINCRWKGEDRNCTQLFNPILTDEGMCCTFNRLPKNYIFSNPRDSSDLNITFDFPAVEWTPEKGYPSGTENNTLPWRPVGAGSHMGLSVVVDAEIDQYYCSSENSVGFKVLLHNPIETPKVASFGSSIPTARETRVMIEPKIRQSAQELIGISVAKRGCYFERERQLKYYKTYTQRNCNLECEANFTLFNCNCVLYYMSKDNDTRICGGSDMRCAGSAQRKVEETVISSEDIDQSLRVNQTCNCLPGCWELGFGMQLSASPLSSTLFVSQGYLGSRDRDYFAKNMAVIHFFFTQKQFTATQRGVLYGFTEFLSNTGGILGLFMGFSFLSVVEIVYYLSLRVFCAIRQQKKIIKNEENQQVNTNKVFDGAIPFTQ